MPQKPRVSSPCHVQGVTREMKIVARVRAVAPGLLSLSPSLWLTRVARLAETTLNRGLRSTMSPPPPPPLLSRAAEFRSRSAKRDHPLLVQRASAANF